MASAGVAAKCGFSVLLLVSLCQVNFINADEQTNVTLTTDGTVPTTAETTPSLNTSLPTVGSTPSWNVTEPPLNWTTPDWNATFVSTVPTPGLNGTYPPENSTYPNWNGTINPTGSTPIFTEPPLNWTTPDWNATFVPTAPTPGLNGTYPPENSTYPNWNGTINPTGSTPIFNFTEPPLNWTTPDWNATLVSTTPSAPSNSSQFVPKHRPPAQHDRRDVNNGKYNVHHPRPKRTTTVRHRTSPPRINRRESADRKSFARQQEFEDRIPRWHGRGR